MAIYFSADILPTVRIKIYTHVAVPHGSALRPLYVSDFHKEYGDISVIVITKTINDLIYKFGAVE